MIEETTVIVTEDDSFDQTEAPQVIREYVCGTCHGELTIQFARAQWRVLVVCPDHGNVTKCGRVMRSSVDIEMERASSKFNSAIRNLSDLWGSLLEQREPPREGESRKQQNLRELGF